MMAPSIDQESLRAPPASFVSFRLRLLLVLLTFFSEIVTRHKLILPQSGFLKFLHSSKQFFQSLLLFLLQLGISNFRPSRINFQHFYFVPNLHVYHSNISVRDSRRKQCISEEHSWQHFHKLLVPWLFHCSIRIFLLSHRTVWSCFCMVPRIAIHKVSSICQDISNASQKARALHRRIPTIFQTGLIVTVQQTFLLFFCALLSQQFHRSRTDGVSKYYGSIIILHRICQISRGRPCKWLSALLTARETFVNFFPSSEKVVWHLYDCIQWVAKSCTKTGYWWFFRDSHLLIRTLWSAVMKSPNFCGRVLKSPDHFPQGVPVVLIRLQTSQFGSSGKWKMQSFVDAAWSKSWEMFAAVLQPHLGRSWPLFPAASTRQFLFLVTSWICWVQ